MNQHNDAPKSIRYTASLEDLSCFLSGDEPDRAAALAEHAEGLEDAMTVIIERFYPEAEISFDWRPESGFRGRFTVRDYTGEIATEHYDQLEQIAK